MLTMLPRLKIQTLLAAVLTFSYAPFVASADARLATGQLPAPLITSEQCVNVDLDSGWGWNGQQSCYVTSARFIGQTHYLAKTRSDYGGTGLAWNREDVANQTIRCDRYRRARSPTADTNNAYSRERYDITFLTDDVIPANSNLENLSDVTAHLYTRGWQVKAFGNLETGLQVNFNSGGYTTENGYILVDDTTRNSDNDYLIEKFSHCFYRDNNTPLRATGYCADFDGDGIGWNGSETCTVAPINANCDYTAASIGSNYGWGYNTVTGESCPPAGNTTTYQPEDRCRPNGPGGWGWNEALQTTCRYEE